MRSRAATPARSRSSCAAASSARVRSCRGATTPPPRPGPKATARPRCRTSWSPDGRNRLLAQDIAVIPCRGAIAWRCAADMVIAQPQETSMAATDPSAKNQATSMFSASLAEADPEIAAAIGKELGRQRDEIELIASENIVSKAVLEAQGSVLTNKYAEGLPGRRYYGGCQYVDIAETLAIERVTKLFGCR